MHGSIGSLCPETALQVGGELSTIEPGTYLVEKGIKLAFDASILLGFTWGSILKVDPQPFLFAGSLKGLIFSCIIAAEALYLQIELRF